MGRPARHRKILSSSVSPELYSALQRLSVASGTPISRLVEQFLNVDVLNGVAESLEMAKRDSADAVASHLASLVGRHILSSMNFPLVIKRNQLNEFLGSCVFVASAFLYRLCAVA